MTCERASWPGLQVLAKPGVVAEGRGADLVDRFGTLRIVPDGIGIPSRLLFQRILARITLQPVVYQRIPRFSY